MTATVDHKHLWSICQRHVDDFDPWGRIERGASYTGDCSCGCRWYAELAGPAGSDWGVCMNPASHRVGLLTFEHQGCGAFEPEDDDEH